MPTSAEIWRELYGTWRLARLDRQAMSYFDLSHRGVWRSFWAAALCYPGFLVLLWLRLIAPGFAPASLGQVLLVETIGYVVAWTAFPLAALAFCRWLGDEERGFDFIAAYNWSQVLQTALFVSVALIGLGLPKTLAANLEILCYLALLAYEWFIAFVAVGAGGGAATVLVLIDAALGFVILVVTSGLG